MSKTEVIALSLFFFSLCFFNPCSAKDLHPLKVKFVKMVIENSDLKISKLIDGKKYVTYQIIKKVDQTAMKAFRLFQNNPAMQEILALRGLARKIFNITNASKNMNRDDILSPIAFCYEDLNQNFPMMLYYPGCGYPYSAVVFDSGLKTPVFFPNSVITFNISGGYNLTSLLKNSFFQVMFAHENAHSLMVDLMGVNWLVNTSKLAFPYKSEHDSWMVTNQWLAFSEGWAEGIECYIMAKYCLRVKTLGLNPSMQDKKIFMYSENRHTNIINEESIWSNDVKNSSRKKLKNPLQMLNTEGVVATQVYKMLSLSLIKKPFRKAFLVLSKYKPLDWQKFLEAFVKEYPQDKKELFYIFLETTRFITASPKAANTFEELFNARPTEKNYDLLRKKWNRMRVSLLNNCLKNDKALFLYSGQNITGKARILNLLSEYEFVELLTSLKVQNPEIIAHEIITKRDAEPERLFHNLGEFKTFIIGFLSESQIEALIKKFK